MTYFLTDLDPNSDAKGSRDPLGYQPIWQQLGRRLVAHLTTTTSSLRGFSVLLLGLELAERALQAHPWTDREARENERLACFLRFEQLAAYARCVTHGTKDIRGINRVKRKLQEGAKVVTIGSQDRHQILAEQRTYGVWGLYMSAARGSGLVTPHDARLTDRAREYIEAAFVRELEKSTVAELSKRVCAEGRRFEPEGKDQKLAQQLGAVLGPTPNTADRALMSAALMEAAWSSDPTHGDQMRLWVAMREYGAAKASFPWRASCTYDDVVAIRARADGPNSLSQALDAILAIEPLLAVSETIFNHLLGRQEVKQETARADLYAEWPRGSLRHLRSDAVSAHANEIALAVGDEARARLEQLLCALRDDDFQSAISLLLEQNDTVMRARGGAGWFEHRGPTLRARFFAEPVDLPARKQLPKLWSHSYFLDSIRWLGADIESLAPRTADGN